MSVILNETEYVETLLEKCTLNQKPIETLGRVARYYGAKEYKRSEIHRLLEEFLLRCDPSINIVKWQKSIDRLARGAYKYKPLELESIGVCQEELDICDGLKGKQMSRLMFTLICLAKFANAANSKNDGWVNKQDKEIFKMANVVTSIKRQSLMLNDLRANGLVRFSRKVDNININVQCLKDSPPALFVSDFRNLGYQYMRLHGEPYFECQECGLVIKRTNNSQKYCHECSIEVNRQKTRDNMRKSISA